RSRRPRTRIRTRIPRLPRALGDPHSLGAVVVLGLLEPGMLQGLFGGDALLGVVDEDLAQEVEELIVESGGCGDEILRQASKQGVRRSCSDGGLGRMRLRGAVSWP